MDFLKYALVLTEPVVVILAVQFLENNSENFVAPMKTPYSSHPVIYISVR